ncbi:TPA: hypothetical protein ACH3X3_011934 [Trebouxia sp. C0006]
MAAITVKREGTGDIATFDTVAEVGSAAEFISYIEKVWGEGVLLKPSSTSAFTARTPEPFPHGIYTFLPNTGPSENMIDMRQQLTRIEAATLNTFHHMFAPSISDLSQRSKLAKRICTTTYNADDRPAGQLWCMVLIDTCRMI